MTYHPGHPWVPNWEGLLCIFIVTLLAGIFGIVMAVYERNNRL